MSAPLRIAQRSIGEVVILELDGRLIVDEGDRVLSDHVKSLVTSGSRALLVDLKNVTYVDSGGIGALVALYTHVMRRGGRLKLLHPSPCATRVLHITHLESVFEMFDDEPSAIRSFDNVDS